MSATNQRRKCCDKCEAPPVIGGIDCWDENCECHKPVSEMVERVAKAIRAEYEKHLRSINGDSNFEFDAAKAAIAAMREPTWNETEAGMQSAERAGGAISSTEIKSVWQAMIDKALADAGDRKDVPIGKR